MRTMITLMHRIRAVQIRRWARARLRRNDAVILDTETTSLDGEVVQMSVIDCRGAILLSTLIKPAAPITATAAAVHGITDVDVADAPSMADVAPRLLQCVDGKWLLAYNAPFDRDALLRSLRQAGCAPGPLHASRRWRCLMRLRAATEDGRWSKLGGPHHALGDCIATLQVLRQIADPPRQSRGVAPARALDVAGVASSSRTTGREWTVRWR